MNNTIEQMEDIELMAYAYTLANQIDNMQKQQIAVQAEIEKRSVDFIKKNKLNKNESNKQNSNVVGADSGDPGSSGS